MPANNILTIDMITAEAVRLFKNSNLFIQNIDTQYDSAFAVDGAKIGDQLRIRLPNDYVVNRGPALQLQATNEQYTTLTIDNYFTIAVPFTSAERALDIDNYSERVMAPIINNIAGDCAAEVMTKAAKNVANFISNVDVNDNIIGATMEQFVMANAILDNQSADQMTRNLVNNPITDSRLTTQTNGLLNPSSEISAQYRSGMMKSFGGYNRVFRDQTSITFRAGTFTAGTVSGADQTVARQGGNLVTNAITGTLKKGDVISIENVNAVNFVTKQNQETVRQFVVTADVASGAVAIPIYPGIIPYAADGGQQQYQTVNASPANGAVISLATKASEVYRRSLAYVTKAVTMATADLPLPTGAVMEVARAQYDGISMRVLTDYLPQTDQIATRTDLLFGSTTTRPEWLTIVADKI